jgi:2-polyprenyl-6-hydroxyphenyl methylase/3-demethylubiquinone-9 3-methyltransferase
MTILQRVKRWLADQFGRVLGVVYYKFFFDRESVFSDELAARVLVWEQRRGKGDVPIPVTLWEQQYESGHWDFLTSLNELGRFSVVGGYVDELKPDASVLDVGCGEGLLQKRLHTRGSRRYLGLDVSAAAIARARAQGDGPFICADAERYVPDDTYDVIVFNESLYYFIRPLETVSRYVNSLSHDGIMIVSTFPASRRGRSILRALKKKYAEVDETRVAHGSVSWICTVFRPVAPPSV